MLIRRESSLKPIGWNLLAFRLQCYQSDIERGWLRPNVKSHTATLRLKTGFIIAVVLISPDMLTGDNARQTQKKWFRLCPSEDADLLSPSAAILGLAVSAVPFF